jgi:hypothetical protein
MITVWLAVLLLSVSYLVPTVVINPVNFRSLSLQADQSTSAHLVLFESSHDIPL